LVDSAELVARMQACVPDGFRVFGVREVPLNALSLMSQVVGVSYAFVVDRAPDDLESRVDAVMSAEVLPIERKAKQKKGKKRRWSRGPERRTIDLKPHIGRVEVVLDGVPMVLGTLEDQTVLSVELKVVEGRGCKPSELIGLLGLDLAQVRVVRLHAELADPTTGVELSPPPVSSAVFSPAPAGER
jgi:hypothetical protein